MIEGQVYSLLLGTSGIVSAQCMHVKRCRHYPRSHFFLSILSLGLLLQSMFLTPEYILRFLRILFLAPNVSFELETHIYSCVFATAPWPGISHGPLILYFWNRNRHRPSAYPTQSVLTPPSWQITHALDLPMLETCKPALSYPIIPPHLSTIHDQFLLINLSVISWTHPGLSLFCKDKTR